MADMTDQQKVDQPHEQELVQNLRGDGVVDEQNEATSKLNAAVSNNVSEEPKIITQSEVLSCPRTSISDNKTNLLEDSRSHPTTTSTTNIPLNSSTPNYVRTSGVQQRLTISQISLEQQLEKSKRDLESMVIKYATSERENLQNKIKVEDLDKKLKRAIKDNDSLANRIKLLQNDKNQLADTLSAKVAQLTVLEQKNLNLNNVQDAKLKELEEKVEQLENVNDDLLKQIETYKCKEGELLDFSERLSMKQILLQAELDKALEQRPDSKLLYDQVLLERDEVLQQNKDLLSKNDSMMDELEQLNKLNECLKEELSGIDEKYRHKIDVLKNEIKVMRRKHQMSTKELMKELKQMQAELGAQVSYADSIVRATS